MQAESADKKVAAQEKRRVLMRGRVVSTRMDKTITVEVERLCRHPKYGKFVKRRGKYLAHDEKNEAAMGEWVEIVACRPLSRRKSWRLCRVLGRTANDQGVAQ